MHLFFSVRMPWLGIPSRGQAYAEVDVWMQYVVLLRSELTKPWLGMPSRGAKAQRRSRSIVKHLNSTKKHDTWNIWKSENLDSTTHDQHEGPFTSRTDLRRIYRLFFALTKHNSLGCHFVFKQIKYEVYVGAAALEASDRTVLLMDADEQDTISAMLSNAKRISRLTEYIGLFEWLLFAWFWKRRVIVHMGSQLIDVVEILLGSKYDQHLQIVQDASIYVKGLCMLRGAR